MAKVYPRPQTLLIFVLCLVVVGATAFYMNGWTFKNRVAFDQKSSLNPISLGNQPPVNTSTDWQKQFYDNNSNSQAFKPVKSTTKVVQKEEPLTTTDQVGRNFFTKYVQLRQAGLTNDNTSVSAAVNQVIADGIASVPTPKTYTNKDILVVNENPITLKTYAEDLLNVLKSSMPVTNESEIALKAYEKGDMSALKEIDPIIASYKSGLNGLISTPVPQPLAIYHLDLINGLSMQIFNAQSLRRSDTDPVTGLAAINLEVKSLQAISTAVANMQNYFGSNGVNFVLPVSGSLLQNP
ncbi:MAG: hypothetical protein WCT02_01205 [Candidatus Paceibacterota bacterium]